MLDTKTIKKIEDFVYSKPRSIQEIAKLIGRNWRTADRHVCEIGKEYGTITTRIFREGTRGALKVVYWASIEKAHSSIFQEKLFREIKQFKGKEDFSAFDVYQHISKNNKSVTVERVKLEHETNLDELKDYLSGTKKQLLVFSGNLSWINLKNKKIDIFSKLDDLAKGGVSIKIISRVDLDSINNIQKIFSLNFKHGKDLVEIRHAEQPLRAIIFDNKLLRMKEIKEPTGKINELNEKIFIFYNIKDKEWIEWSSRLFWNIFSNSIDANKRLDELKDLT